VWRLKRGVTWHDGRPFTADDVIFTWQYAADSATAATSAGSYQGIDRIDRIDDLGLAEAAQQCRASSTIDAALRSLAGESGDPESFSRLDTLLDAQAYRLAYWRVAADEINFPPTNTRYLARPVQKVLRPAKRIRLVLERGDVDIHTEHPLGSAILSPCLHATAGENPDPVSLSMAKSDFAFVGRAGSRKVALEDSIGAHAIPRMRTLQPRLHRNGAQLLQRVANNTSPLSVKTHLAGLDVPLPRARLRTFYDMSQSPSLREQSALRMTPVGNIGHATDKSFNPARAITDRACTRSDECHRVVFTKDSVLAVVLTANRYCLLPFLVHPRGFIRIQRFGPTPARCLSEGESVSLLPPFIGIDVCAGRVAEEESRWGVFNAGMEQSLAHEQRIRNIRFRGIKLFY